MFLVSFKNRDGKECFVNPNKVVSIGPYVYGENTKILLEGDSAVVVLGEPSEVIEN